MELKNSRYAKYIKEREDFNILENESGFLTYKKNDDDCFIGHFYVDKDKRKSGKARELIEQLKIEVKQLGCKTITGSIDLRVSISNQALLSALLIGFKAIHAENGVVLIRIIL